MPPLQTRDLATYAPAKLFLTGLIYLPVGILAMGVAFGLLPWFVSRQVAAGRGSWGLLILAAVPLFWAWFLIPFAIRRLRESREKDCWLRADLEALSLRLPGNTFPPLNIAYEMWEYRFLWGEVEGVDLFEYSVNGMGRAPSLILRARGGKLFLEAIYFQEDTRLIKSRIEQAANSQA